MLAAVALLAASGAFAKEKPKPWVVESPNYVLAAPPADQAQIVFVEPINRIQGMFPSAIFEVVDGKRQLLAINWWKGKTVALLPPGKHMLFSQPTHMLEANVEAGKRYYVLLRFIYAQGFQLRPIRTSGTSDYRTTNPEFARWLKETRWVEKTPEGEAYFTGDEVNRLDEALNAAIGNWQAKTPAEAVELTLNPDDAVTE
jgi:hypothetical protein